MDELREYVQQLIVRKVKIEVAILFAILWLVVSNFIVYNYDIVVYYMGYLNLYFEAHVLNQAIAFIFYIRFFILIFVISTYIAIACCRSFCRKYFGKSTDEDQNEAIQELRHQVMITSLYSCESLTEEQIETLNKIERDKIIVGECLGNGAFGEVFGGHLRFGERMGPPVALKSLRREAKDDENAFMEEAYVLRCFDHGNIVHYIGICLGIDENYIIMELMAGGDLLNYLREYRALNDTDQALSVVDLLRICVDVAVGCQYLEDMGFVHRNLACRNCHLTSKDPQLRQIKICGFSLARKIDQSGYYSVKKTFQLPVRWMAPESLTDGIFTYKSDVWSFGVLCWEVMTLGYQPYEEKINEEVLKYVKKGGKLERPEGCSDPIFEILDSCWAFDPEHRHSFSHCLDLLELQLNRLVKAANNPKIILAKEKEVKDQLDEKGKTEAKSNSLTSALRYPQLLISEMNDEKLEQNLKDLNNLRRGLTYDNRDLVDQRSSTELMKTELGNS